MGNGKQKEYKMKSKTEDLASGAAAWRTGRNIHDVVVFDSGLLYDVIHKTGST